MTDRLPNSPGKYSAVVAGGELQKMQTGNPFAITLQLNDDPVKEGTPYSKAAVLPDELAAKLCPETEDPAPKDAFRGLWEKKADSIRRKSGTVISADDAAGTPLNGLKICGKTMQNRVPTPDAPVELVSVGASGSIGVTVAGKNLFDASKGFVVNNRQPLFVPAGTYITLSAFPTDGTANLNFKIRYTDGTETGAAALVNTSSANNAWHTATIKVSKDTNGVQIYHSNTTNYTQRTVKNAMVRIGNFSATTDADYEPYKEPQTLTASTPNGLPGIPVSSGGNYTDENGQQWICDEIDFARGVYVQRVYEYTCTGAEEIGVYGNTNSKGYCRWTVLLGITDTETANYVDSLKIVPSLSNKHTAYTAVELAALINNGGEGYGFSFVSNCRVVFSTASTVLADFIAEITGTKILYQLATPIETALSAEELEAYALLHTNEPNTTVMNDAGADMEISYYTPNAAVPVVFTPKDAGKVLSIDEHGCVALINQKDRVVEQGVSGNWTYRKWDSGIAECWLKYTTTVDISSGSSPVWDKFYRSYTSEISLPFVFAEMPMFNVSVFGDAPVIYDGTSYVSNSVVNMIQLKSFVRAEDTSKSYSITYCVHAIGRWK